MYVTKGIFKVYRDDILEVKGRDDIDITGVTYDSRKSLPDIFSYVLKAFPQMVISMHSKPLTMGRCLVVEKGYINNRQVTIIKVSNSRKALGSLCSMVF